MSRKAIKNRVRRGLRGGSFDIDSRFLRSSYRRRFVPVYRIRYFGFRLIARKK